MSDSDAGNLIDSNEAILWFITRGDECLNCGEASIFLPRFAEPLIIHIHKSIQASTADFGGITCFADLERSTVEAMGAPSTAA